MTTGGLVPDLEFLTESVTTALTGLLLSDAYNVMRPRLRSVLSRSRQPEVPGIEDLDRLRGADPETLRSAVRQQIQCLAGADGHLLRRLSDALESDPSIQMDIHDNDFRGGQVQMGGVQIINMYEAEHEHEL